jgi:hypothetical protein
VFDGALGSPIEGRADHGASPGLAWAVLSHSAVMDASRHWSGAFFKWLHVTVEGL